MNETRIKIESNIEDEVLFDIMFDIGRDYNYIPGENVLQFYGIDSDINKVSDIAKKHKVDLSFYQNNKKNILQFKVNNKGNISDINVIDEFVIDYYKKNRDDNQC